MKICSNILNLIAGLIIGFSSSAQPPQSFPISLQARLEEMAQRYTHFSPTVIVSNRPLQLQPLLPDQDALGEEQLRLLAELPGISSNRDALVPLLQHRDPKVRTLALGALFQREAGRDLPLIAGLLNDTAGTFPLLEEPRRAGGSPARSEWERSQSVADVAQSMLTYWGVGAPRRGAVSPSQFQVYWAKYAGRTYAASWFRVKMNRATRRTTPIQPQYRPDIDGVAAQIDSLPPVDRAWTRLFVLCPEESSDPEAVTEHRLVPDQLLVETARELGPDSLLRFLRRERVSDDPDLNFSGKENLDFARMAHFVLFHAGDLLRAADADALLALEESEHGESGLDPTWVIGAAALQPAKASALLRARLQRENPGYVDAGAQLAAALWRSVGPAECDFLTDWFYAALPNASEPFHQPEVFLRMVRAAGRKDTDALLSALMRHPRFDLTDWQVLKEVLQIVNAERENPLVTTQDIYASWPPSSPDQKRVLAHWRNLLRRELKLPERADGEAAPQPRQVLRQAAYAVPIPTTAWTSQLIVSASGRFLATLREGNIDVWDSSSGQHVWSLPRGQETWCSWMAFRGPDDHLLVLYQDRTAVLNEWDVTARKQLTSVLLTNQPMSGVSEGAYAFDQRASRVGFAGPNDVACFDARTGLGLWVEPGTGGVRSSVSLSPDGKFIAFGGGHRGAKALQVRDAGNGDLLRAFDEFAGRVEAVAFTADGQRVAAASAEDGLRLWNVKAGQLEREFAYPPQSKVAALTFSPDGQWLAVAASPVSLSEARIGVFRVQTGILEFEIVCSHSAIAWFGLAAFSPDGKVLYTADQDLAAWRLLRAGD